MHARCNHQIIIECHVNVDVVSLSRTRNQYTTYSTVWSPWQQGLSAMLEKVQHHAARFVLNDLVYFHNSSVTNMLSRLQWDSLELRREKSWLHMLYKSIHGLAAFLICQYVLTSAILMTRASHPFSELRQSIAKIYGYIDNCTQTYKTTCLRYIQ